MSLFNRAYRALYFAVQGVRGGVAPALIDQARAVLEAPRDEWTARALARLRALHGDRTDWAWLRARPLVERLALVPVAEAEAQRGGRRVEMRRTSGSTGTPFRFPKDREMTAWMDAAMWAVYSWHGLRPGAPHARFWGAPLQRGPRLRTALADRLLHRRRVSAFELTPREVEDHFRQLRALGPDHAYGYPTLMRAFAELCREAGLDGRDLGVRVVVSTGEILSPATRRDIASFFGCRVVNEYGCTESGIVGFECEEGTMHAIPVAVWPEVVDDGGRPLADGQEGEVVVSDLFGAVMPLLRYRLHDRGMGGPGRCPCGRDLPELRVASGRTDSFIETPRGRVYDAILAYTVPASVQRFKVYQTSPTELLAHVVPGEGFRAGDTPAECRTLWEKALGPGMTVTVETVEDLPLETSGKLRYFVPMGDEARR